jgi:hypothetical protein
VSGSAAGRYGLDPATNPVLRVFLDECGRLRAMPAKWSKRLVVLDYVAQLFEPGVRYSEADVSAMLRALHPDYAMLRRYLVDEGFLEREDGIYWRSGGIFVL